MALLASPPHNPSFILNTTSSKQLISDSYKAQKGLVGVVCVPYVNIRGCYSYVNDYHVINNGAIHQGIGFLLDYLPAQMRLVIVSRTEPPRPLSQLRGRVQLTEVRTDHLRFTCDEVMAFLNQAMALDISDAQVETVDTRTEGWIVGLQMAALSMR